MAVEEFSIKKTLTVMAVFLKEKLFCVAKSASVIRTGANPVPKGSETVYPRPFLTGGAPAGTAK
jgi:hypothetical protein